MRRVLRGGEFSTSEFVKADGDGGGALVAPSKVGRCDLHVPSGKTMTRDEYLDWLDRKAARIRAAA